MEFHRFIRVRPRRQVLPFQTLYPAILQLHNLASSLFAHKACDQTVCIRWQLGRRISNESSFFYEAPLPPLFALASGSNPLYFQWTFPELLFPVAQCRAALKACQILFSRPAWSPAKPPRKRVNADTQVRSNVHLCVRRKPVGAL